MQAFLGLNGRRLAAPDDDLIELVLGVAEGRVTKAEGAVFVRRHGVPRGIGRRGKGRGGPPSPWPARGGARRGDPPAPPEAGAGLGPAPRPLWRRGAVTFSPSPWFQITVSFIWCRCRASSGPYRVAKFTARSTWKTCRASAKSGWPSSTWQPSASKVARCASSTVVTRRSTGSPPRSRLQATRTPLKSRPRGPRKRSPGSAMAIGERGSGPAIVLSIRATSATVRAMGPGTCSVDHGVSVGHGGTRPGAPRRPTTLQKLAGLRREPPVAVPLAIGTMPQAGATAEPPLEPPHVFVGSYGLSVRPKTSLNVCEPAPNSGVLVLPMVTAPAARRRSTRSASWSGT